jgi:RNA ligase (TIGR02306 family)
MDRKLASIQIVSDLRPIPEADKIVVAKVLGWECVALKEEFNVGDFGVYFEIDSILPVEPWTDFLRKGSDKPFRLRTIRLKKQLSQGLMLPISKVPWKIHPDRMEVGADMTVLLNVTKYEPIIPAELSGKVKGNFPSFLHRTDEVRLQSEPEVLTEAINKRLVLVGTVKMDGTSFTAYLRDGEFGVCSRNLNLIETAENAHWKMARKLKLEEALKSENRNLCVQGELCGGSIQGNRAGLKDIELHVFNLYDIDTGKYLNHGELREFCQKHGLTMVKTVGHNDFSSGGTTTLERLLELSNNLNYDNGLPAEGIVWRPLVETYSDVLKGRSSFKVISNRYIEKYKE